MKKSEDHIDNLFKNNLENQRFEIPSDFMDDLNSRLDAMEPKHRRKGGFWFFIFNGLFLVTFVYLMLTPQSSNDFIYPKETSSDSSEMEVLSVVADEADSIPLKQSKTSTTNNDPIATSEGMIASVEAFSGIPAAKSSINLTQKTGEAATTSWIPRSKDKTVNRKAKASDEQDLKGHSGRTEEVGRSTVMPPDTIFIRDTLIVRDTVVIKDTLVVRDTVFVRDTIQNGATDNTQIEKANWKFEVQLFGGLNVGSERFSTVSTPGVNYLLAENPIWTPSFGFGFNAEKNKMSIGSGLEYLQTGERFSLNSSFVSQIDTIAIVGYDYDTVVFNPQTQTWDSVFVPVYDSVSYLDTITTTQNWLNAYSWISIPISFGYRFNIGKWALIPKAGVTFNLGMRNEGKYAQLNGNDVTIAPLSPVRWNLDYLVQLEFRRKFKIAEVYLSPIYRGNITPMIFDTSGRKYQSLGFRCGLVIPL